MKQIPRTLREPQQSELRIVVPYVAPSVNHYKSHNRAGRVYVTSEAKKFKFDVALLSRGSVRSAGGWYDVQIRVYLGKGGRGDADNFAKICMDSLVDARIITSDARAKSSQEVHRDWVNPRTEIFVREWNREEIHSAGNTDSRS